MTLLESLLLVLVVSGPVVTYCAMRSKYHRRMSAFWHELANVSEEADRGIGRALETDEILTAWRKHAPWLPNERMP